EAARSQANALRNDMKGLFQTDQERKRRDFLDRRYQNMVTGESIYTSIQMAAQRNRDNNHALF
ncbi:MAG: hypothetical protein LIQ31_05620, partial [Planctomycetes bacterium]|nr:hypothetical protein [Planctomycetota bacterium]